MFARFLAPSAVAAWTVFSVLSIVSCGPTSPQGIAPQTPAVGLDVETLAPSLSPSAKIYLPGSDEFTRYTVRWSNLEPPTPNLVIAPGTERDVAKIVRCSKMKYIFSKRQIDTNSSRSNSRPTTIFPFSLTMVTMVLLLHWAGWTTVSRSICLN